MRQFGRYARTVARVMRTRYPPFALGLPLARGEIPVFTYHDVETSEFAGDLEFLRDNAYRALTLDEYLQARAARRALRRSVLLTFDDARKSFLTTALPLLRAFNFPAVLFAPTYWMTPPRDARDDLFMNWAQLRCCVESGLVDVQSHAHRHALVFTAPQVADFATPSTLARFDVYDWPMRRSRGEDALGRPAVGSPVYRAAPLLTARRRYIENEAVVDECRGFVERNGGERFFGQPRAKSILLGFHARESRRSPGEFMREEQFRSLVASEFELTRAAFEANLGYAPTSIAYPWMLGSVESLELARRVGMRAAFGVALDFRAERRSARLPVPVYARLKCDWLRSLPGVRRTTALAALRRKIAGRAGVQHLAH